jgi:mRNA interferase MazF
MLLLHRDEAYAVLSRVAAAPLTTSIHVHPAAVQLDPRSDGVPRASAVNLDSIQAIQVGWLDTLITRLRPEKMEEVERAIHFALGLRA